MTITKKLMLPGIAALAVIAGLATGGSLRAAAANADSTTSGKSSTTAADTSTGTAVTTVADTTTPSTTSSSAATTSSTAATQPDPSKGGHTANGITETVLTGDTATKAIAAAKAAEPGAVVIRAETDAEGATYEVHMTKSDGSAVTIKLDANFKVTSTETGM